MYYWSLESLGVMKLSFFSISADTIAIISEQCSSENEYVSNVNMK